MGAGMADECGGKYPSAQRLDENRARPSEGNGSWPAKVSLRCEHGWRESIALGGGGGTVARFG
jgi:hypothetical protein